MKKILVVDDDLRIASAIALRLEAEGYDVLTAPDGLGGLEHTLDHRPDLIVMDILMPNGIGFDVAERLRDLHLGGIPIIFISASKRPGVRRMARKLGGFAFIEKPYDASHLLETVARALAAKEQMAQALYEAA